MMKKDSKEYYLAIDIGASSGRHILGYVENGILKLEEVYRFSNGMQDVDGSKCWNVEKLFSEIKAGMRRCMELNKIPRSVSVDTWGCDFVLLDASDQMLGQAVGYRDSRTKGMDEVVSRYLTEEELYTRTGIQKLVYNTIYQLMAIRQNNPELLAQAETFLMIPDYFHYLLTGQKSAEYTICTTGQLVNLKTGNWDYELFDLLGYPKHIFPDIKMPGTVLGNLTNEVAKEVGFDCQVVMAAGHDTASAVMSVPAVDTDVAYISSGTWSLLGVELWEANVSTESRKANFTNEGGYDRRYRFLKDIMGLWLIQSVRHELEDRYSFGELCAMAEEEKEFSSRIDVDQECFFAPESMIKAIQTYCSESGQLVPETPGEIASVVYQSLAESYGNTLLELEKILGREYPVLYIVGGGSHADYLNQLTANRTGKTVYAGPVEATAIGNLLAQMIREGIFQDLKEARNCVKASFPLKVF